MAVSIALQNAAFTGNWERGTHLIGPIGEAGNPR